MTQAVYLILAHGRQSPTGNDSASLRRIAEQTRVRFRPLHPGVEDAELSRFYIAEGVDAETADRLVRQLGNDPGVEAVYMKPPDEPP